MNEMNEIKRWRSTSPCGRHRQVCFVYGPGGQFDTKTWLLMGDADEVHVSATSTDHEGWSNLTALNYTVTLEQFERAWDSATDYQKQVPLELADRKVEMIVCWDDGTWSDCHFVEVDGRVPAEEIPRVAEEKLLAELEETAEGGNLVVHVGVYHIEEADEHS